MPVPPVVVTLALPSFAPLQEMLLVIWLVAESKLGSDKVTAVSYTHLTLPTIYSV